MLSLATHLELCSRCRVGGAMADLMRCALTEEVHLMARRQPESIRSGEDPRPYGEVRKLLSAIVREHLLG